MGLTRERKLQKKIQEALDDYVRQAKRVPIVRIEGYFVYPITEFVELV